MKANLPLRLTVTVGALAAVCGCASGPRTTVILLPDADGHVGAVSVRGAARSEVIDQAFDGVTVRGRAAVPSSQAPVGEPAVVSAYGALMKAQPPRPVTFVLQFERDTVTLTEESKALIPAMIDAERRRAPTEVAVFGHADSTGSEHHNFKLSRQRAQAVADLLMQADPTLRRIDVEAFGDQMPLPGTLSLGPEPRNRRAEVQIL
ncbi:MAG TPA: OmpA family protein [Burkholderiaceae bacterium]|jgi:outer membrane protein OmpA-like peptidoglycan-associated protein|nr:OmpA family protein [Burkholderiaceae bacterium]